MDCFNTGNNTYWKKLNWQLEIQKAMNKCHIGINRFFWLVFGFAQQAPSQQPKMQISKLIL